MLDNLIREIEGWQDKTPTQILDLLSAKTELFIDDRRWTLLQIADVVGKENMDSMIAILKQNGFEWAVIQAGGSGMPLGHPEVNQTLRELRDVRFETLANETRRMISPVEKAGLSVDSIDIMQAVQSLKHEQRQQALLTQGADVWNAFVSAVNDLQAHDLDPVLVMQHALADPVL
jgi:uncharacterized protein (DUF58 family)